MNKKPEARADEIVQALNARHQITCISEMDRDFIKEHIEAALFADQSLKRELVGENTKTLFGYSVSSEEALAKKVRAEAYEDAATLALSWTPHGILIAPYGVLEEVADLIRARAKSRQP